MFSRDRIEKALEASWKRTQEAIDSGVSFIEDRWKQLPFFASVEADVQKSGVPHDETHYFLIPYRLSEKGYTLYSTRRVPEGFAEANDLPKRRVFHLPGAGGEAALKELIVEATAQKPSDGDGGSDDEDWGARLNAVADEIDRHSQTVTGGVLLIGGIVALMNPVVGAGIAAKALFPSVGAILTREGLRSAGKKLSTWRSDREARRRAAQEAKESAAAEKELSALPVHTVLNPLLETLERALCTTEAEFDPLLEFDFAAVEEIYADDGTSRTELLQLSAKAVLAVYSELLASPSLDPASGLGEEDRRWLKTLEGFLE